MYVGLHNHTATGSNIRGFLDSTNRIDELIKYSKSLGHNGIAITDHDCISVHMQAIDCVKELKQKAKDNGDNSWEDYKFICVLGKLFKKIKIIDFTILFFLLKMLLDINKLEN